MTGCYKNTNTQEQLLLKVVRDMYGMEWSDEKQKSTNIYVFMGGSPLDSDMYIHHVHMYIHQYT